MKNLIRACRTTLVFTAIMAMPHMAFAVRTFSSVTVTPNSTNVTAGAATTNTANVAIANGSGASTRFIGNAQVTTFVTPASGTISATVTGTNFAYPNANTTYNFSLTVTTTAGTPAGTYVVSVVADTNNPFVGDNITPVTNTYTLNVGAVFVPQKIWTPTGANTNWSTAGNWTASGVPVSSNDVDFFDAGATNAAGTVNNVVDSSLLIGSLNYGQTNNFHTTLIPSGVTLTVGGTANGLNTGTGTDPGDSQLVTAAITGAGALTTTNKNSNVNVTQSHVTAGNAVAQSQATLDMSGLNNFTATISRLLVGADVSIKGACGVLNLAKTNSITATTGSTAPQIDVGDNTQASGSPTIPSVLRLGQTNGIFADSITIGRGKTDNTGASMIFNNAFASPTAYLRGTNGNSSRVGNWLIGDGFGSRTYYTYGTCDFSLGTVDALVDTMYVGRGASVAFGSGANNPGTGTLTFGAGNLDINTLEVGYSTANASGTGTVNANGGSLVVNTFFELAHLATSSGTLNLSGAVKSTAGITAGGGTATINMVGGSLTVTNGSATIATTASPLNTFSVSNSTLNLSIQSLVPSVAANNLSAASGTVNTINVSSVPLLTGFPTQFPIIQYGLNGGSGSGDLNTFALGTLPSASPAYGGYISNNVVNNSIDIVFTNGPSTPSLTWDGTPTGNWNLSTPNWRPKSGPDTTYADGDFVTFDDSLTGTTNVNLTITASPASLTFSNSTVNYNLSGVGNISGSAALVKNGSGSVTLAETGGDNFSGGILLNNGTLILDQPNGSISGGATISGGTLQIGNNDANGSLPSGGVSVSGVLAFDHANNISVNNTLSGAGTIAQNDTNIVTLSGNSTFSGAVNITQGTLQVGSSNGLGSATSVLVSSGATFDVGGFALFGNGNSALAVTVSGAGVGGNGAIVNSGGSASRVLHNVTLAADTTFGGTGDWDIRNSSGNSAPADASLNGAYNLTKVGTNSISLRGVAVDSSLGNIVVQAGNLTFTATATAPLNSLGDSSKTAIVSSNATLTLDTIGTIPSKNFVLTNGGTLKCSGTNTFANPLTLIGPANNTISVGSGAQFTITSAIVGGGGFSKNGSGPLFLTATNTYSGNTVVSGGTLALYGGGSDGSISSSVSINLTGGATIDVSGRSNGTFTLAGGQTLIGGAGTNGPGTIVGNFIASLGSLLAPGSSATNTGTLSVISNATLSGATVMKISAANGNDQLDAQAITYGGALTVTNFSGAITNGQTFQLFIATNGIYNAGNFSSVALPSATGLTWTNTLTNNGRITAGVVTVNTAPTNMTVVISGNQLIISWPADHTGWHLQAQTNTLATGLGTNWVTIPNTDSSNSYTNTIDAAKGDVFYRMIYP